jgi:hypothetical protein
MKTEYHTCPSCQKSNKVTLPEDFDDRVEQFLESAPSTVLKGLASLAAGVFIATPVGWVTAGALLAKSIYDDGTIKCAHCNERFRIR